MDMWLPFLAVHFPGSGITPFNVWELDFWYWRIFRARASEVLEQMKKEQQASRKGRR